MRTVRTLPLLAVLALAASLSAQAQHIRPPHFFEPPSTLFFFRPDLYLHSYGHSVVYTPYFYAYRGSAILLPPPVRTGIYQVILRSPIDSIQQANTANLIFQVEPRQALVYIDDRLIGSAGDFSTAKTRYQIVDGIHTLRIEAPGFSSFESELEIVANRTLHLKIELKPSPATRP